MLSTPGLASSRDGGLMLVLPNSIAWYYPAQHCAFSISSHCCPVYRSGVFTTNPMTFHTMLLDHRDVKLLKHHTLYQPWLSAHER